MKATTTPGVITVQATPEVTVSYNAALNLVEVTEGTKVVRSEIAPARYTAGAFVQTVERVKTWYSKN